MDLIEAARRVGAPLELDGRPHQVAASIGIARSSPGTTPDSLLRDADTALYAAKAAGRGRSAVHRSEAGRQDGVVCS